MADPVTAATVAMVVGTVGSAAAQVQSGRTARRQANIAAEQEEIAATAREADRKSRLADALASQNAAAGARNVAAFEGSPLSILQEDIRREEQATERDRAQTRLKAMTIRFRGAEAKRQAEAGALFGLLRAGSQMGMDGKQPTTPTGPSPIGTNYGGAQF